MNPYPWVILALCIFMYLAYKKFDVTIFFLEATDETKGVVTSTGWTHGPRGWGAYQVVNYQYKVGDSIYVDMYKAGQSDGMRAVGDSILLEFSKNNPSKNKRLKYYRVIQ